MGLQYGIKEVANLSIVDFSTNKPLFYVDYAEVTSNEVSGERLDLRGGQGNSKLLGFDHTKDSTLQVTLPLVDLKALAMLGGEDLVVGASNVFKRETLTVSAGKVTLAQTPITDSAIVYELKGTRDNGTEYSKVASAPATGQFSVSGKDITVPVADNGKTLVIFYQYATPATAQKISVKANKFPKAVKIYGTGIWKNQENELDYPVHITAYKAKVQPNFTFTMSATDATSLELTFDLYAVTANNGDAQYIDYVVEV